MRAALVPALAVCLTGCVTSPKKNIRDVPVPAGLNAQDVERAIISAITRRGEATSATSVVAGNVVSTRVDRQTWFLEAREPGIIMAGTQQGSHYLRVAIHHSAEGVRFVVDDSRGLRESENRIHWRAFDWIGHLEVEIRHALGRAAANVGP